VTREELELYNDWLARPRLLLEAKQWTEAMRDVPRLTDLQPAILCAALRLLETAREPFTTIDWQPETTAA
jgi:hypothetical protein